MGEINYEILDKHVFVTKLAGFEHTEYIQKNQTKEKNSNDDIPMVQGKNIRNGFFVEEYDWYINKDISLGLDRSRLTKDCILVPYVGSNLGEVGIFYHKYDCHLASNVAKIELIDDYFDLEYLKYYLQSPIGQGYLFQAKQGSAQPNITMEAIRNTKVIDLPKNKQLEIVKILNNIDLKFQNNNKIINELESMTKTLYDYWFLQFEFPNEEGKPYKSSGGKMVYNEELKREIPVGWEVSELLDLVDWITNSQPPKSDFKYLEEPGYVRFIQNRDYDSSNHVTYIPFKKSLNIVDRLDILMDKYGDAGVVRYGLSGAFNVALAHIKPKNNFMREYIRSVLLSNSMYTYFHNSCMASTRASLSEENLKKVYVIVPPKEILFNYEKKLSSMRNMILKMQDENQELSSLRDFLLPMLMNGQVTFK